MTFTTINYTVEDGVAVLTLNRPDRLNSFNTEMHGEVREALRCAANDKLVRCVVLTGAGRGFCAGQDLSDRNVAADSEMPDLGESVEKNYNPLIRALMGMEKPIICAVNGVAAGAGANIALACDIVVAAESASFIEVFCNIGLIPDSGGTWNLPRAVGLPRAKGLALLGEKLPAKKAEEWGLIWKCVEDDNLMDDVMAMARRLATQPTKGLGLIKKALNESTAHSYHHQLELEKEYMRQAGRTHDYREGVAAFMEKRKPEFKGE
ncbi:2-(1,2-epoxy-1,2-dihydrophenyl)acetyl-CoA isomerase PaaG [Porticoccaceae bacterium LTM1]|nr:2-(1,2-epoxy-1,2-dihydrophenyl)acetyl-CoA isomerase PaaG [Porticoccaceae bacterium LTM1]